MNMHLKNGDLSQYALALGYTCKNVTRETASGHTVIFELSYNGCTYDIYINHPQQDPVHYNLPNGGTRLSGWIQCDTLTEARKLRRELSQQPNYGLALAKCLTYMSRA